MNESDMAPVAIETLHEVRKSLQRIRAQARAGEKITEGIAVEVTAEGRVDIEALFDAIAHEVESLVELTEPFDIIELSAAA